MDDRLRAALRHGHRIDITTTGRRTGLPRRIELVFHNVEGRIYLSGRPRFPRGWLANLRADPRMTFHLKGPVVEADLPATGHVITDREERQRILAPIAAGWGSDLGLMVEAAPLVEVRFDELAATG